MKILQKTDEKIIFSAEIENGLINAVRRYVGQIPVLAIDEVEISKNDSPLYDETLAHRIGLVPLERGKSSKSKEVELSLTSNNEGIVYSGELKGSVKVAYDKIPLVILSKEQELELKAVAKFGKGNDHAKFSPGLLVFREAVEVKIEKDCPNDLKEMLPKKIAASAPGKIKVDSVAEADQCEEVAEICHQRKKEYVTTTHTGEMIITMESFGQIPPEEIFKEAVEELKKDLESIKAKV